MKKGASRKTEKRFFQTHLSLQSVLRDETLHDLGRPLTILLAIFKMNAGSIIVFLVAIVVISTACAPSFGWDRHGHGGMGHAHSHSMRSSHSVGHHGPAGHGPPFGGFGSGLDRHPRHRHGGHGHRGHGHHGHGHHSHHRHHHHGHHHHRPHLHNLIHTPILTPGYSTGIWATGDWWGMVFVFGFVIVLFALMFYFDEYDDYDYYDDYYYKKLIGKDK